MNHLDSRPRTEETEVFETCLVTHDYNSPIHTIVKFTNSGAQLLFSISLSLHVYITYKSLKIKLPTVISCVILHPVWAITIPVTLTYHNEWIEHRYEKGTPSLIKIICWGSIALSQKSKDGYTSDEPLKSSTSIIHGSGLDPNTPGFHPSFRSHECFNWGKLLMQ